MTKEYIPVYDHQGLPTGSVGREDLYASPENNHRVVHNLAYMPLAADMHPERMWVQVRSEHATYLPGHIVTAAGGHVNLGADGEPESFEAAMQREISEEILGGRDSSWQLTPLGKILHFKPDYPGYNGGSKDIATFVSETDGSDFSLSEREVAAIMAMPIGQLKAMSRDPSSLLHPELREILKHKMVRLGIVGTYSAGKTTLTNALTHRIEGAKGVTEDVRQYVRNYFGKKGIQELTPEQFIELEHMLFMDQNRACRTSDIAIIDSTPIGCPVYLQNYGLLAANGHTFDDDMIQSWMDKTADTLDAYDAIIYLPPEIPYEADGFRTGPEFRGPIDAGFREIIKGHPRMIEVRGYVEGDVATGVNRRVDVVLDYCQEMGILDSSVIKDKTY